MPKKTEKTTIFRTHDFKELLKELPASAQVVVERTMNTFAANPNASSLNRRIVHGSNPTVWMISAGLHYACFYRKGGLPTDTGAVYIFEWVGTYQAAEKFHKTGYTSSTPKARTKADVHIKSPAAALHAITRTPGDVLMDKGSFSEPIMKQFEAARDKYEEARQKEKPVPENKPSVPPLPNLSFLDFADQIKNQLSQKEADVQAALKLVEEREDQLKLAKARVKEVEELLATGSKQHDGLKSRLAEREVELSKQLDELTRANKKLSDQVSEVAEKLREERQKNVKLQKQADESERRQKKVDMLTAEIATLREMGADTKSEAGEALVAENKKLKAQLRAVGAFCMFCGKNKDGLRAGEEG